MDGASQLSEREREILRLVATGVGNKEIAQALGISPNTVKVHVRRIFAKLGVETRAAATRQALEMGLVMTAREEEAQPSAQPAAIPTPERRRVGGRRWAAAAALVVLAAILIWALPALRAALAPPTPPAAVSRDDVDALRWERLADLPEGRAGMAAAVVEGRMYVMGGQTAAGLSADTLMFDLTLNTWEKRAPLPEAVRDVQAVVLGERLYLAGGVRADGKVSAALRVYDPRADVWTQAAAMPAGRSAAAAAALDGRLYLFGGWDGQRACDTVWVYDPSQDRWTEGGRLPQAVRGAAALPLEGRLMVMGGWGEQGLSPRQWLYAPQRQAWEERGALPAGRGGMGAVGLAGQVYVGGGSPPGLPLWQTSWRGEAWQALGQAPLEVGEGAAVVGYESRVYVIGGRTAQGEWLPSLQAYRAVFTSLAPVLP